MKNHVALSLAAGTLLTASASSLCAQEYHPYLTDTFHVSGGAYISKSDFKFRADGTIPGDEIDFDEALGVDDSHTTPSLTFRWNFGEKWSFWGQGWKTDSSGTAILTEDVNWEDLTFREGSNVTAGVDTSIARLFFGRKFHTGPQHEFGAGLGLHWIKISAYIEGEAFIDDETSGFQRGSVDASAPLPNIGAWFYYSPASRWLLKARVDWLSANIGDYSGGLWNVSAGVNFQFTEHFGLELDYQFFQLNVDVDDSDWNGSAKASTSGPFVALTASW